MTLPWRRCGWQDSRQLQGERPGRRPPACSGRTGFARAGGAARRRACGPAPAPCTNPKKQRRIRPPSPNQPLHIPKKPPPGQPLGTAFSVCRALTPAWCGKRCQPCGPARCPCGWRCGGWPADARRGWCGSSHRPRRLRRPPLRPDRSWRQVLCLWSASIITPSGRPFGSVARLSAWVVCAGGRQLPVVMFGNAVLPFERWKD